MMNTYGELSNASLLHTYGFTEVDNPHDEVTLISAHNVMMHILHLQALISCADLKAVFLSKSSPGVPSLRKQRWNAMEKSVRF